MINKITVRMSNAEPPSLGEYILVYTGLGLLPSTKQCSHGKSNRRSELPAFLAKGSLSNPTTQPPTFASRSPSHA